MPFKKCLQWEYVKGGGLCRVNHAAAHVGDMIYSFGGFTSVMSNDVTRPIDVHQFNTSRLSIVNILLENLLFYKS